MKKCLVALFLLLALPALNASAELAIQIPQTLTPFQAAQITLTAPQDGTISIHITDLTLTERDVVTAQKVEKGTNVFSYDGLSFNQQPLRKGAYTVTAEFEGADGQTTVVSAPVSVLLPLPTIEYALPSSDTVYLAQTEPWFLDCKLAAKGNVICDFASAAEPDKILFSAVTPAPQPLKTYRVYWKWLDKKKNDLPEGEYVVTTYAKENPSYKITNALTVKNGVPETPAVTLTGSLYPENLDDDAAVWAKLMEPVVVLDAAPNSRAKFYEKPSLKSKQLGSLYGTTVAVNVLELGVGDFAKIGAYCSYDAEYREGYILQKYLKVVYPNAHYGAVLDKNTQQMTIYGDGKRLGVLRVSTGLMTKGNVSAETRAGVFLTYDRLTGFHQEGYMYEFPIRIDGPNLIHQIGYTYSSTVKADFTKQQGKLDQKASHGCVRIDNQATEASGGLNAYWCWTHFAVRTKIIILDDTQARQAQLAELRAR